MTELDFINKPLTIKDPPDFTVVSTFAGCGGSSTGYVWAGGKVLLAVEWDDNAVETYRLNYPDTDIYHGDIAALSVDEVLERTGLQPGKLDVFDGSPPCQGFSTAGKRMIDDPRNQLFREYIRLLRGLRPKVMVMENVSGMVKGKMKLLFAEILTELKASGYNVKARLLNAKYLGVPQSRERMIFIGVRNDLGIEPSHPKPQTRPITVGQAWRNISQQVPDYLYLDTETKLGSIAHKIPFGKTAATITGSGFNVNRLGYNTVCPTITKPGWGVNSFNGQIHPNARRKITTAELIRLASFPDCYSFGQVNNFKTWTEAYTRIGNSVPPRMMQYIAEHIRDEILSKT